MGAETHVDNSIENPEPFVRCNVLGTMNILEFGRKCKNLKKLFYMGTDEVFGPADSEPLLVSLAAALEAIGAWQAVEPAVWWGTP